MKKFLKRLLCFLLVFSLLNQGTAVEASASELLTAKVTVTYKQTQARKMLSMVNSFRTSSDAWYWNSSDTEKIKCTDLENLTYDYALEKVAMQRAAEIALYWDHVRPDGTSCFTAYDDYGVTYVAAGENIAAGTNTSAAKQAFTLWKEENESYSGQGHRRNMLSSSFNTIAVSCVKYNGIYYWTMELAYKSLDTAKTASIDSSAKVKVNLDTSEISKKSISVNTASYTIAKGSTKTMANPTVKVQTTQTWPSQYCKLTIPRSYYKWTSSNTSVATVDSKGKVTAVANGTATIKAKLASGYSVSYKITVYTASK